MATVNYVLFAVCYIAVNMLGHYRSLIGEWVAKATVNQSRFLRPTAECFVFVQLVMVV